MACDKFCEGAQNTSKGIRAISLDREVATEKRTKKDDLGWFCPMGCSANPTTKAAVINIKKNNGGLHTICLNNSLRYLCI